MISSGKNPIRQTDLTSAVLIPTSTAESCANIAWLMQPMRRDDASNTLKTVILGSERRISPGSINVSTERWAQAGHVWRRGGSTSSTISVQGLQ